MWDCAPNTTPAALLEINQASPLPSVAHSLLEKTDVLRKKSGENHEKRSRKGDSTPD